MVLLMCDHFDILLIFNCIDVGQFLGKKGIYLWCWFIDIAKIISRTVNFIMWYDFEIILFKSGWVFSIIISEEQIKTLFISLFYCIVQIVCIRLHKSDFLYFLKVIIAQISDVAHLPPVLLNFLYLINDSVIVWIRKINVRVGKYIQC